MCAVGLAVLDALARPGFLDGVTETGQVLAKALTKLSSLHGLGEVRGRGLLLALSLSRPMGPEIVARAFEAGLLINAPRPDALRFMPSLTLSVSEIEQMAAILDEILMHVKARA